MEIWNIFFFFGSVVITVTSVITVDGISSDPRVSDAYQTAHLNLKSLAERYIMILKSQLETCVSLASAACKKEVILTQLGAVQNELDAFEAAMKGAHYECKSSPPSVEHASAVVTNASATQQVAKYTCDTGYTYGGGERMVSCDHSIGVWGSPNLQCVECFTKPTKYQGKMSITQGGIECQRWDTQSPHKHGFESADFPEKDISAAGNYCRNPKKSLKEPWCYTTDANVERDYCGIPNCKRRLENDCGPPQLLTNANSHYSYTSNGARASYVCLTLLTSPQSIHCPVSSCKNTGWTAVSVSCGKQDCFRNSAEYTGKRNCTVSGRTCQAWSSNVPHEHRFDGNAFIDGSIVNAGNYCRDPDGSGALWCFTTDNEVRYEVCDVPNCDKFP